MFAGHDGANAGLAFGDGREGNAGGHYSGVEAIKRMVVEHGWDPIDTDVAQRVLERVRTEVRHRRREPSDRVLAQIVEEEQRR